MAWGLANCVETKNMADKQEAHQGQGSGGNPHRVDFVVETRIVSPVAPQRPVLLRQAITVAMVDGQLRVEAGGTQVSESPLSVDTQALRLQDR